MEILKLFSKRRRYVRGLWKMFWKDEQWSRISARDSRSLVLRRSRDPTMFNNWSNTYVNRVLAGVKLAHLKPHQPLNPLRPTLPQTTLTTPLAKLPLPVFLVKKLLNFETNEINFFKVLEVDRNQQRVLWKMLSGAYCEPNWNSYIPCQHHTRTHFLLMTLSSFSTIIPHPPDLPSQPLSLLRLHTSLPFPSMCSMTPTFR